MRGFEGATVRGWTKDDVTSLASLVPRQLRTAARATVRSRVHRIRLERVCRQSRQVLRLWQRAPECHAARVGGCRARGRRSGDESWARHRPHCAAGRASDLAQKRACRQALIDEAARLARDARLHPDDAARVHHQRSRRRRSIAIVATCPPPGSSRRRGSSPRIMRREPLSRCWSFSALCAPSSVVSSSTPPAHRVIPCVDGDGGGCRAGARHQHDPARDRSRRRHSGRGHAAGALSIQPIDDAYVGEPYLNKGLGGVGPGLLVGLHIQSGGLPSTPSTRPRGSRFSRLVEPCRADHLPWAAPARAGCATRCSRFWLALISAEAGPPPTSWAASVSSWIRPRRIMCLSSPAKSYRRQVFTAGVDVVSEIAARTSIVVTARGYFGVARNDAQQQVGIGRQIVRVGAGIRLRLGA